MFRGTSDYNTFAGMDICRSKSTADGIFAFAVTLLVPGLSVPISQGIVTENDLWLKRVVIGPELLVYFMSFITLGNFWISHAVQYTFISKSDRNLTWISLFFLLFVSLVPFTTALLSAFITVRLAIAVYWANILLLVHGAYAGKNGFTSGAPDCERTKRAVRKRLFIAESLYAGAVSPHIAEFPKKEEEARDHE